MKPSKAKRILFKSISTIAGKRELFRNPNTDFTRNRKLTCQTVMQIILSVTGGTLNQELLDYFRLSQNTVTSSAFVQQRAKISQDSFKVLFQEFTRKISEKKLYHGLRLFAVDGSDIHIPTNSSDPDSFFPGSNGQKPYNLLHLNVLYDLLSHTYQEALLEKGKGHEHNAVIDMLRRAEASNVLLIADRGYESYNLMANCQEKGWHFLIRVKDLNVGGIAIGLNLPKSGSFDVPVSLSITRMQTPEARSLPGYKHLADKTRFDLLSSRKEVYPLHFRAVRFPITADSYETVFTDLPAKAFPSSELKTLYAMRWGVETSFRDLKYTIGLLHFHSKKTEFICQEVFAALTMYNFAQSITQSVVLRHVERKLLYKVNFSQAAHVCLQFFRSNISPPLVETLIARYIVPVRPDRHNTRNLTSKQALSFLYRVA